MQQQQQQQYAHQQHPRAQANQYRHTSSDRGSTRDSSSKSKPVAPSKPEYVGPYLLGKTLGKGSSGCVKLARHRRTNEQVAIKIISKASLANRAAVNRGIEREIAIMKLINHPHVIRLYDVYETEKELFLIMEYVSGGELFEYLVNKGRLDEPEALRFFQQIIVGLAFCHKRKVCHRDLKPENLLLDHRRNVKIADFGMASLQKSGRLLETSCGSPHYASPEVVTGMKYDGSSSDIWSCGIILYALLTGHLPFDDENIRQLLSKVKAGKFYMPTDISASARDLISRMLTVNPRRRITMQGVMMHPWFTLVNLERNTLGEPAQDPDVIRSMVVEELDAEIIRHMRWLFAPGPSHSDPEAKEVFDEDALLSEIQEKMVSSEENMEKLFYRLLFQHKTDLLENYSGDDSDTVPDAPRRRADSFPNSTIESLRSATPDFNRVPLLPGESPLTSPGSPLSPIIKGVDPTPLTLNPEQVSSVTNGIKRHQSSTKSLESGPISTKISGLTSRHGSDESTTIVTQSSSDRDHGSTSSTTDDSSIIAEAAAATGNKDDRKAPFSPKLTPVSGSIHESLMTVSINSHQQAVTTLTGSCHPLVHMPTPTSQLPPIHPKEATAINSQGGETKAFEVASPQDSIEQQVMSTQISENSHCSSTARSALPPHQFVGGPGFSFKASFNEKILSAASTIRSQRPILHPLDVKTSAGTTTMNVSASQHSRKFSEGASSICLVTPITPTGPKRPWFARLFDFKPQPLSFKSKLTAVETQERVECILRDLFQPSVRIDYPRKPSFGLKCWFDDGGNERHAFHSSDLSKAHFILARTLTEKYPQPSLLKIVVIDDQMVKAVKFKVDITEKTVSKNSNNNGNTGSSSAISSSAMATALVSAEQTSTSNNNTSNGAITYMGGSHNDRSTNNSTLRSIFKASGGGGGGSSTSSSSSSSSCAAANGSSTSHSGSILKRGRGGSGSNDTATAAQAAVAAAAAASSGRRASDGGSILSHFTARLPFTSSHHHKDHHHNNHPKHSSQSSKQTHHILPTNNRGHRHSVHGGITQPGHSGNPTLPPLPLKIVKVTLNQQRGANSTLKKIFERLCEAWDSHHHFSQEHSTAATAAGATTA
ncbi:hypothetical protein KI688_008083 [Linnemannia hyalina]|uniref:Protein kinase domain-containing protein n=1 Tax=Linnemannia hyalina TaxID=64524 RepID=A0A9P7Y050_9FUNG|nr:hypothetical protein KI688_008083 [Linnemannia hyalina]